MDRLQATILEHVGRCRICGHFKCGSPKCLRQVLEQEWTPPLISRAAFDGFVTRLMRGSRWSRAYAEQVVRRTFTPAA